MKPFILGVLLTGLLGLALPLAPARAADGASLELGLETSTGRLLLPVFATGTLTFNHCAGCRELTLSATADTTYFWGPSQITLAELRSRLATGPGYSVTVYANLKQTQVRRVVVSAPSLAPAPRR